MTHRITVRGDGTELRGQYSESRTGIPLQQFSYDMAKYGMVIASQSPGDVDMFAITDPDNPPSFEKSRELIEAWFEQAGDAKDELLDHLANVHSNQAAVIRGERHRGDTAESELMHRELHHFEAEQAVEQIKGYLQRHLTADGWTGDPHDISTFLGVKP